ncbi:peroxide stress protein YaaA [Kordiimonas marina]|uniref:peroxide stress protein YaaA n=1 Tax=Kordiimonas marina TaxID=2872312 RepID=UPI001FF518FB|nr:peroxide stress protein YaaA [Kordiimonas marina]MCJ9429597.1 peroxide stress protein YaaA [Kordiimonas marina]
MLIVLSPAKKLDFERENYAEDARPPRFMKEANELVGYARKLKSEDLKGMMGISDALAELNVGRFKAFKTPFTPANARPALDAFRGDVYVGLDADTLDQAGRAFADSHVRILSGLYGLLRPLDLMQAYRLEMGTKFATDKGKTLYAYWGDRIAEALNDDLEGEADPVIVNLASGEYFKAVKQKALKARVITPVFKEVKNGEGKVISFLAKKARGLMTRYVIDNRITEPEKLKAFDLEGYKYDPSQSDADTWVFTRPRA